MGPIQILKLYVVPYFVGSIFSILDLFLWLYEKEKKKKKITFFKPL